MSVCFFAMRPDSLIDERLCHEVRCFRDVGSNWDQLHGMQQMEMIIDSPDFFYQVLLTRWTPSENEESVIIFSGAVFFGVLRGVVPGVPSLKRTACHVKIGIGKFIGKFPKPFLLAWAKPGR